ncbi:MAG: carbonic anhydrase family protein [Nitrospirae bacterium]|nr:carbonic anhydrase family protein [Nitrospirota bacterium]
MTLDSRSSNHVRRMGCILLVAIFVFTGIGFAEEKPAGAAKDEHKAHWSYEGDTGPDKWGDMSAEQGVCKTGKAQSPVDIKTTKQANKKTAYKVSYKASPLKIINNGHTIQVNYEPGSTITIDGKTYQLLQFHFHDPSEHTVLGKSYPMELHLVHKNDKGELAVLGVFMKEGKENATIKTLWDNLPDKVNEEKSVPAVSVNASTLLPKMNNLVVYRGSLTTPPCSEGVSWNVVKTPIEVSKAQIDKFISVSGKNARPVQPLNDRQLQETK